MRKYLTRGILGIGAIALVVIALAAMTSQFTGGASAQNPCVDPNFAIIESKLDAIEVKLDAIEVKLDGGQLEAKLDRIEMKLDERRGRN